MSPVRRKRLWIVPWLVVACVLATFIVLRCAPQAPRPNVLWITIDSLRSDHLGCNGYERAQTANIDRLARQGALFTQCVSQATFTNMSVPSMITGKYPYFTGVRTIVPDLDSSHVTLAEALSNQEYFTCAFPEPWLLGFLQGFQRWQQISHQTQQKTQWCLQTLDGLDTRPFFIWLYYWDPHAPYNPPQEQMQAFQADSVEPGTGRLPESIRTASDEDLKDATGCYRGEAEVLVRINQGRITPTDADRIHLIDLYDAEIALVDVHLGQVLDSIRSKGLWDNTLVVLNADHGESFGEHGRYYHGLTLYEEEVRVPLIIKPAGFASAGKIIDGPVRNLDIMPTILDYCGVKAPRGLQGQSLRPQLESDAAVHLPTCVETHNLANRTHLIGYRTDQYMLIYNLTLDQAEMYHLSEDAAQRHNLLIAEGTSEEAGAQAEQTEARLQESLLNMLGAETLSDLKVVQTGAALDPRARERLKALGYIY